jgi:phospholipase C
LAALTAKIGSRSMLLCSRGGMAVKVLRALATAATAALAVAPPPRAAAQAQDAQTTTPIKHVIVIVGENRSFDHVFATYQPRANQSIANLLSQGIVNADGSPGPNFSAAAQNSAVVHGAYQSAPPNQRPYQRLPAPNTDSAPPAPSGTLPPFSSQSEAAQLEDGLDAKDIGLLLTGATGLPSDTIDTRIANARALPPGPFQLTPGAPYDSYTGDPVHRFYQMWQQLDCDVVQATAVNPSGCRGDLYAWVGVSIGNGSNGAPPPSPFDNESTNQGGIAMAFYNMQAGDAPFLKSLADRFTLADNYHQAIIGGSTANAIALGTGDVDWYSDGQGNPVFPPVIAIEDPDPQPGTNNFYINDGGMSGALSDCSDPSQPGVGAILAYLGSLPYAPFANCAPGTFYLLNNASPGFLGDGSPNTLTLYQLPPSSVRTIGDALNDAGISWKYYGESFNLYLQNPTNPVALLYCDSCNPFQYATSIMTDPAVRTAHLRDGTELYRDIRRTRLPAVAFVKPNALNDGHPASSKLDIFEAYVRKILETLRQNPALAADTAVLITFDEGGGYYDSGYVQPLDFFGDGPRVPLIAVSPFSRGGRVVHQYYDHVSILKFIEANWQLPPLTGRSRDNLPNPIRDPNNPYVPLNPPAIGNLMTLFRF